MFGKTDIEEEITGVLLRMPVQNASLMSLRRSSVLNLLTGSIIDYLVP